MTDACKIFCTTEEYKEHIIFISNQIEKCKQSVQENFQEIEATKNKKEKLLLSDLNFFLERKIKYLTEELSKLQYLLKKSSSQKKRVRF